MTVPTPEQNLKGRLGATLLWVGLIILITFITYLPTLRNGFVIDDFQDVVDNQLLHTGQGLRDLWHAKLKRTLNQTGRNACPTER